MELQQGLFYCFQQQETWGFLSMDFHHFYPSSTLEISCGKTSFSKHETGSRPLSLSEELNTQLQLFEKTTGWLAPFGSIPAKVPVWLKRLYQDHSTPWNTTKRYFKVIEKPRPYEHKPHNQMEKIPKFWAQQPFDLPFGAALPSQEAKRRKALRQMVGWAWVPPQEVFGCLRNFSLLLLNEALILLILLLDQEHY